MGRHRPPPLGRPADANSKEGYDALIDAVTFIWMMVVLKIPIAALLYIVWWAVHDPEPEQAAPEESGGQGKPRDPSPRRPRPNRRGPHGSPPPARPSRVRVARGRKLERERR